MTTAQDHQSRELLPCPFCGTIPTLEGKGDVLWITCPADSNCRNGGMAMGIKKEDQAAGIASWNRRTAPARGVDPMLDTPAGMEPVARVCQGAGANIQWRKGMTYADLPAIDGQDLYTAAQVQAMGRVPPGWQTVPVDLPDVMVDAFENAMEAATTHVRNFRAAWRALLAATPRPPVAQDELEIEQTRREAESLAWSLFNRHYAKGEDYTSGRSVFGLCDSLRGVLSQIDNMTTGLVREPAAQERKPLTNKELGYIVRGIDSELAGNAKALIRAVERAHGIT